MSSHFDDFRLNLKFYREKCSFSQFDLSVQEDCSTALVGNIEAGRVKPSYETIIKFSEALKIHPADLFLREISEEFLYFPRLNKISAFKQMQFIPLSEFDAKAGNKHL